MALNEPVYIESFKKGLLKKKAEAAWDILKSCVLCPRKCGVDRQSGETGVCKTGMNALVSSYNPHFGEEAPLVGSHGSGTIFFTHCNLLCIFCQNFDISHQGYGEEISNEQLADLMLQLQNLGCHNINFVTPTHIVPHILKALEVAVKEGLSVPLVYNSSAYDSVETLRILEGVFDIYMPDFKFWSSDVGDFEIDESGIARRGLLIRHLVLPANFSGTQDVLRFIAQKVSSNSYVNIMPQYRPCGRASEIEALCENLSSDDYEKALQMAKSEGITRLDMPRRVFMVR
ncbi:MAG: radical SAM protein [Deltaproteobacteria bacterium]|nr:radical SAM protein [Deltaproteobacteria bacterium]